MSDSDGSSSLPAAPPRPPLLPPDLEAARSRLARSFRNARDGANLSVALFDVDHLSAINESRGHAEGDRTLLALHEALGRAMDESRAITRIGGEEFLLLLGGGNETDTRLLAERVRRHFHVLTGGKSTVSVGIASLHRGIQGPDELLQAADQALYLAKSSGRNEVRVFGEEETTFAEGDRYPDPAPGERVSRVREPGEMGRSSLDARALPSPPRVGEGRRILVIEDDSAVLDLLATFLAREGFTVETARSGAEAQRALAIQHDIVVTDVGLPDVSGNDLVSTFKSRWPLTQVIVMTGERDAEVAADALNAGADRYIFKPFGLPELRPHLIDALQRSDRLLAERQERRRLNREARDRGAQAREAILKGARALVRAVEVRDPYTRGHSDRVATYAVALAHRLQDRPGAPPPEAIRLACELHDVGKIGVPDAILNKEGPLTRAEFREVERHPKVGRRILDPLLDDEIVLSVVSWHHERWDGGGYPDGLRGDAIPLAARVVAVADTLDAMTSHRAYRRGLPWEVAVEEVRRSFGSQFDPSLAPVFEIALPDLQALFLASGSERETRLDPLP